MEAPLPPPPAGRGISARNEFKLHELFESRIFFWNFTLQKRENQTLDELLSIISTYGFQLSTFTFKVGPNDNLAPPSRVKSGAMVPVLPPPPMPPATASASYHDKRVYCH